MNVGISVSRVGGDAQIKIMKKIAGKLKIEHALFRELEAFTQFGSDLDKSTMQRLTRGRVITEILKQPTLRPIPTEQQVALFYAATNGYLDTIPLNTIKQFERDFLEFMRNQKSDLLATIIKVKELTPEIDKALKASCDEFMPIFLKSIGK